MSTSIERRGGRGSRSIEQREGRLGRIIDGDALLSVRAGSEDLKQGVHLGIGRPSDVRSLKLGRKSHDRRGTAAGNIGSTAEEGVAGRTESFPLGLPRDPDLREV